MATLGINIYVCLGDTIIAGTRSNEIQTSVDTIEISSPTSGIWKQHKNIRKDWSLSTSFLCLANEDVKKLLQVGNTYTIQVVGQEGSSAEELLSGTAILTSCKITASVANLVQGSFVFDGNGELTSDQPVPPTPQNPEIAWSAASATATIGQSNTFPTLSNPHSLPITYSSSDTSVATVDLSGVVTLIAAGSANISASFAGSADYYASTVSYALAVALPYDAEVEYLQCTGKQYIDLGFYATENFQASFKIYRGANSVRFDSGAQDGWGSRCVRYIIINGSDSYYLYGINADTAKLTTSQNLVGTVEFTLNKNYIQAKNLTSGNTYSHTYTASQAFTTNYTFFVFAVGVYNPGALVDCAGCRLYYFKATDTNVNLDLIPVRIGQVGYLYDKNSGTLFGKVGTEDFVLGPDKN
ncbi:MAG: hypothetical protein J6R34_01965 [Clostridia bacterium]|nr:hypothetical protein [Clostridia bacterium]